ncbi:MAG: RHS repeat-associated core domain-containing protein [Sphingobacteriaceae bacterium]|nr:MAG: RHS repeat-associated core domain-containing protein [Sphingobacteriaceae bacterium]
MELQTIYCRKEDSVDSIVTNYLGTPVEAYNEAGSKVWYRELDCYGQVRKGNNAFIPFLYQGQYWDEETGLVYNQFRYYSADQGKYVSQDPIRLAGGTLAYGYVHDTNEWIYELGLSKIPTRTLQKNWKNHVGSPHINPDIHHSFPEEHAQRFKDVADIDVNNPKYYYNLPKDAHTKKPGIHGDTY